MNASLTQLLERLKDIKIYIDGIDKHTEILGFKLDYEGNTDLEKLIINYQEHFHLFHTKRVFDYKTIIISLYGCFENYIENLIKAYLNRMNTLITNHAHLPIKIVENHYRLSAEILLKLDYPKFQNITREAIVANLYSCINTPESYQLNVDVFTNHNTNFKHETINDFFSVAGISGVSNRVKQHSTFMLYYNAIQPDVDLSTTKDEIVFEILNDLALKRNDVAHGVEDNIVSLDILRTYINFVEIYSRCLKDIVVSKLLPYEVKFNSISLNSPISIHNNCIICLTLENIPVRVGDIVIAKTQNLGQPFIYGEIEEIQVNHESCDEIAPLPRVDVGLKVGFYAKDNQSFYLLKKPINIGKDGAGIPTLE